LRLKASVSKSPRSNGGFLSKRLQGRGRRATKVERLPPQGLAWDFKAAPARGRGLDFTFDHSRSTGIIGNIMEKPSQSELSFWSRLGTGWSAFARALGSPDFCCQVAALLRPAPAPAKAAPEAVPPERVHASGLAVLSLLQREGRLVDFLKEDMAAFSDAEIGAAARVVHAGCRRLFAEYLTLEPALQDAEGASITVPAGFDAQRIRLTGNIVGQPPFHGTLKHHGWVVTAVRLPAVSELDPRVLAPAEVEL
jgi:hypothetical protein